MNKPKKSIYVHDFFCNNDEMKQFAFLFGTYLHDDRYSKTKETNYICMHMSVVNLS